MRRLITCCICAVVFICGCGNGASSARSQKLPKDVSQVVEEQMAKEDLSGQTGDLIEPAQDTSDQTTTASSIKVGSLFDDHNVTSTYPNIDVDLSSMSSTVVYSEVLNMMTQPDDFRGKVVKMSGNVSVYLDDEAKLAYYSCIIQDATACCANGFEFVLSDDYVFPDDYPSDGEEVTLIGVFDTYEENGMFFCILRGSVMV